MIGFEQPIGYLGATGGRRRCKLQIPTSCTTPHRGPLKLHSQRSRLPDADRHSVCRPGDEDSYRRGSMPSTRGSNYSRREHTLNRLPVLWMRRPREEAEEGIAGLTSSDLHNNIDFVKASMKEDSKESSCNLPKLPAISRKNDYSALLQMFTHEESTDTMNISITYTRQTQGDNGYTPPPTTPTHTWPRPQHHQAQTAEGRLRRFPMMSHLAPPSVNALLARQTKPLTANTFLNGHGLELTDCTVSK